MQRRIGLFGLSPKSLSAYCHIWSENSHILHLYGPRRRDGGRIDIYGSLDFIVVIEAERTGRKLCRRNLLVAPGRSG